MYFLRQKYVQFFLTDQKIGFQIQNLCQLKQLKT